MMLTGEERRKVFMDTEHVCRTCFREFNYGSVRKCSLHGLPVCHVCCRNCDHSYREKTVLGCHLADKKKAATINREFDKIFKAKAPKNNKADENKQESLL